MNPAVLGIPALIGVTALALSTCHQAEPPKEQQAEQQTAAATTQAQLTRDVSAAQSQAATKTVRILLQTPEAIHAVQAAPGASTDLPPAVREQLLDGLGRVRHAEDTAAEAAGGGDPVGAGTAVPAR